MVTSCSFAYVSYMFFWEHFSMIKTRIACVLNVVFCFILFNQPTHSQNVKRVCTNHHQNSAGSFQSHRFSTTWSISRKPQLRTILIIQSVLPCCSNMRWYWHKMTIEKVFWLLTLDRWSSIACTWLLVGSLFLFRRFWL